MSAPGGYIPSIDGLRALAVLAVFLFHLDAAWVPGGFVGVDIFFVISGFVVTASVFSLPAGGLGTFLAHFYARRVVRIGPALVVCLLVSILLSILFIPPAWLSDANERTALAAFFGLSNLALSAVAGDYFSPRSEFNPFTHTWSLAVEEQFYLIFPWLIYGYVHTRQAFTRRAGVVVLALLAVASLACCIWWSANAPMRAFYLLPARYWELGLGVLLWLALPPLQERLRAWSTPVLTVASVLTAGTVLASLWLVREDAFPYPWALMPVLATGALLVLLVARPDGPAAHIFGSAPMVWLGKRSYSLYLWHWPVFVLMRWTVGLETPAQQACAALAALVLAMLSYSLVEQPLREAQFIRRATKPKVVLVGLSLVALSAAVGFVMFKAQTHLSLSVTRDTATWFPFSRGAKAGQGACESESLYAPMAGGNLFRYEPRACPPPPPDAPLLYVVGDSHADAYAPLLRRMAEHTGRAVTVLSKGGCSIFNLLTPNQRVSPPCAEYSHAAMAHLTQVLRPGDVLFLPSLRVPRFSEQWKSQAAPADWGSPAGAVQQQPAIDEAIAQLRPLAQRGVIIVFEAPKPIFKAPPYRCSDWFNRDNPICAPGLSMPREAMERHRAPALAAIHSVVAALGPRAQVWDPFDRLCTGDTCQVFLGGKPLFFDGDHLSGYGNAILFEDFTAKMAPLFLGTAAH